MKRTVMKKYLMPEKDREIFCAMVNTLGFKYTISRKRDTYGQSICTLWLNSNEKIASCIGSNYDMRGTCLGQFILEYFPEQLKLCNSSELYGLSFYNRQKKYHRHYQPGDEISVDGGCGFDAMVKILRRIGFFLGKPIKNDTNNQLFQLKYFVGEYGEFEELSFWNLLFP